MLIGCPLLRKNGTKRDLTDSRTSKNVKKNLSEGRSTLEISQILGRDQRTINMLLQIVNRVARNVWRRKGANEPAEI